MDRSEDDPGPGRRTAARSAVDAAVAREDPEGLLAMGAPDDEYRPEVDDLTDLVLGGAVSSGAVLELWERWFGPGSGLARSPARLDRLTATLADLRTVDGCRPPRRP